MSPTQITELGALPSALGSRVSYERDQPHQRLAELLREGAPRILPGHELEVERGLLSNPAILGPIERVLSARQFECFLERERSLADRGTRRFSLLVLLHRPGDLRQHRGHDPLAELARQLCMRLRSIDLVGRLAANRVEILLTDTEPADARVVAARVEQVEASLGLHLERKIYVYPDLTDRTTSTGKNGGPYDGNGVHEGLNSNGNGRHSANGKGGATTNGATVTTALQATNGAERDSQMLHTSQAVQAPGGGPAGSWPMADLWPLLGVPTPLWKRSLDILFSGLALLVLFPLFVLIAIGIWLDSPGPVIFRQLRAGRGARPFVFYKFRSMIAQAEERRAALADQNEQDGPIFKIRQDPRITRMGRLLRRWSLDELPQLWNVLKGDISLVGPRSPTLDEVAEYERWQRRRLCITGGITCIWQVSGRSQVSFRDWMRMDMRYVACRNLWIDLRLLVLTLPAVIAGRGAC